MTNKVDSKITTDVVKSRETQIPSPTVQKPASTSQTSQASDFLKTKQVKQLGSDTLEKAVTPAEQPKPQQIEKHFQIQKLIQDATTSTFDKIKKLLPIPDSILPLINLILGKRPSADIKVGIADQCVRLTADVKMPGLDAQGQVELRLPLTEQSTPDSVTTFHPEILTMVDKALAKTSTAQETLGAIQQILSTLPSQTIKFSWIKGTASILLTLPNQTVLALHISLPPQEDPSQAPEFLKELLKAVLKEEGYKSFQGLLRNYKGVGTLLDKDVLFKFDGATSQFDLEFPEQLALKINKMENFTLPLFEDADGPSKTSDEPLKKFVGFFADIPKKAKNVARQALSELLGKIGTNTTIVLPKHIRGTINFENPSIQFDPGTTFVIENAPIPDITVERVAWDPSKKKLFLTLKTSIIPDKILENIGIDLSEKPEKKAVPQSSSEGKVPVLDCEFVVRPASKKPSSKPKAPAIEPAVKPKISVFETVRKLFKLPAGLSPLFANLFAEQTQVDVKVGLEDNFTFSGAVTLPNFGISGKASISIPTTLKAAGPLPVKLHTKIDEALAKLVAHEVVPQSSEEVMLINSLFDLVLTLPNQNIFIKWERNHATLITTLPGDITLKLELNLDKREGKQDILRSKLEEILGSQFEDISQLLDQTFTFKWNPSNNEFQFKFLEEQELKIKSLKLKKGGFFHNILGWIVGKFTKNRSITLPREIVGTIDFENGKIHFKKGTSFIARGPLGLSKKLSLRSVSFADPHNIGLGVRGFFRTWEPSIDTTTSNFETPIMAINPRHTPAQLRALE